MEAAKIGVSDRDAEIRRPNQFKTKTHQLTFHGDGGEYFGIWFRDLLLSILTLGIYSAWAKVRRNQYFNRSTELMRSRFDYHAKPESILKGRIILAVLVGLLTLMNSFGGWLSHFVTLFWAFVYPWAFYQSACFRSLNTSYRGVRFACRGSLASAYAAVLLPAMIMAVGSDIVHFVTASAFGPFVQTISTLATFLLGLGYLQYCSRYWLWNNLSFGATPFSAKFLLRDILLTWILVGIGGIGVLYGVLYLLPGLFQRASEIMGFMLILFLFSKSFVEAESRKYVHGSLRLDNSRVCSMATSWGLFSLQLKNLFYLIITLGLYWPWAKVRLWKYRIESLELIQEGPFLHEASEEVRDPNSAGESIGDYLAWDLGF